MSDSWEKFYFALSMKTNYIEWQKTAPFYLEMRENLNNFIYLANEW